MSTLQANCPSCAGPIEFKAGSTIVIVCPFCRSAISRTDRSLEDLGKVAEIAGGKATNGKIRVLDIQPTELHQRTPFFVGSKLMMEELETHYKG